ncbi:MAG: YybH family protein [Thermomicrobiales bacterium]
METTQAAQNAATIARAWLTELQAAVRAVDYERGKAIFRPDVVGFGTFTGVLDGLDHLAADQWMNVWPRIREFTFRLDDLRVGRAGALLWAACPWDSRGTRPDGTTYDRPGRATVILVQDDGRWRAAHTHFSLYPIRVERRE